MRRLNLALAATAAGAAITLVATGFVHQTQAAKPLSAKPIAAKLLAPKPLNVAFLVYPDVEVLDLSGPLDVFIKANRIAPGTYNPYTVGVGSGPISSESGVLTIQPRYTTSNCPQPDILVVPGAPMQAIHTARANRPLIQWLQQKADGSRLVMSVCTGAFLLGQADLLNGRKSTTHWFTLEEFQKQFPKTSVMQGVRFVQDGKFVTAAGISSGIDGALHVVEKTKSKQVADVIARAMQYRRGTPAFPAQRPGKLIASSAVKSPSRTSRQQLFSKTDPLCGMSVGAQTKLTHEHKGHLYGFCSQMCRDKFAAHPQDYVR